MKNKLFIDIDTQRDKPILILKTPDMHKPENKEEATEMLLNDIASLVEALKSLFVLGHDNEYLTKDMMLDYTNNINTKINEF